MIWKKYVTDRPATDGSIAWRMRFACWITNATHIHTLRICDTYRFSTTSFVISLMVILAAMETRQSDFLFLYREFLVTSEYFYLLMHYLLDI